MPEDATAVMRREQAWRAAADQILGRTQGPVLFDSTTHSFASGTTVRPNRNIDATIPVKAIMLVLRGRVVIGTAAYDYSSIEAPQSLVQRIRLRGRHKTWGAQTLWDISGASAYAWPRLFQSQGNWSFSGTTANALDAERTIPMVAGMPTTTGTFDFEVFYYLPCYPMIGVGPYEPRWTAPYYLRDEDWGRSLQLEVDLSDNTGLGDPAATTTTVWTDYMSASGSPTLEMYTVHSLLGPFARIPGRGIVMRIEDEASPAREAAATNTSLYQLRQAITTNIVLKTGIVQTTGLSAGVEVFKSLSDRQLNRTKIILNAKALRDTEYNRAVKQEQAIAWNVTQPEGYLVFSFVDSKNPLTSLRADLASGIFEIRTDVNAEAVAGARQHVIQEMVIGGPFPA